MSRRVNIFLLLGAILSLTLYLAAPIMRIAFLFGVSGMQAIRLLSPWFLLPVIALTVMAAAGLTGHKGFGLMAGGAASLVMLIMLLTMKDMVSAGNMGLLAQQFGKNAGDLMGSVATGTFAANIMAQVLVNPDWGFYLSFGVTVAALAVSAFLHEGSAGAKSRAANSYFSRQRDYQKLYRK